MAEEGAVIGCHSVDEWKQHLLQANESKKLVNALAFLLVWFPIPLVGSRFFSGSPFLLRFICHRCGVAIGSMAPFLVSVWI